MLALDDARWPTFKNGYRTAYDVRSLLKRFGSETDVADSWEEVWNELHHQGDVDTASYAIFPHLVSIYRGRTRDWNIYAFGTILLLDAGNASNPSVPEFLAAAFDASLHELFDFGLTDLRFEKSRSTIRFIIAYIAAFKNTPSLARAIVEIDMFEDYGEQIIEAERND